ncbi:MAG TPA: Re/Si-specific NAD(P)(+) transhydrogenase subunit alpha [Candidatus Lumbricidophila sp.]|nr:Re/Si-specific NAD(P)(+) transhydrogenase subunit alpha [Candidatus Lumbricidophila sp.]
MRIGIVAETADGETRVAGTPNTVGQLVKLGYEVVVERGAGARSAYPDHDFVASGAAIADHDTTWSADVVLAINAPADADLARLKPGATLIAWLSPGLNPAIVDRLAELPITALALDVVPRISRAQSMDVLSSTANIAGYRAVVEAATEFGRFFTGQVTAAGKVPPAKVLVGGAGVAGLAAIGAASSMGAVVRATDPRPEVADQVRSIGGTYLPVEAEVEKSTDGYAKATSEAYDAAAAKLYSTQARDVDIIITTANIPGRTAPILITAADVASMKSGSVIVDLAAANGGNVVGTVPGQKIVTENGVTIIGYTDLARRLPAQASQLYGQNLVNLLKLLTPGNDGQLVLDHTDVVQRAITVVQHGEKLYPPPPVSVSAAPPKAAVEASVAHESKRMSTSARLSLVIVGLTALAVLYAVAPAPLPQHISVLVLSVVIGFSVIGKVAHALHTPLMSVTNAISGIVVVGSMLQLGSDDWTVRVLAFIAALLVSINIFGGFSVTRRMLRMFQKEAKR